MYEGERKTYTQESFYIPLCTILPSQLPTQVHEDIRQGTSQTSRQTFVVQQGDGCSVCLEASQKLHVLQAQGGGGTPRVLAKIQHVWQWRREMEEERSVRSM